MEFDVAIIGAGPAGGSAAIHCSRRGLSTIVLEEHSAIGEPVHCGECLSQYALGNTSLEIPNSVVSRKVSGIRVVFPNNASTVLEEEGFVLEKHLFEQWLAGEAEKNGAKINLSSRVSAASRVENGWKISVAGKEDVTAKTIVDASGVQSVVSRYLNLNARFESVIGFQYEMEEIPQDEFMDFYIWPKLAPNGYLWMIPKSRGRANVGLVTTDKTKAKVFTDEFLKIKGWSGKKINKSFGGLIPASGPLPNTYDERLLLVGDAAGFTSPLFEGGTHLSLKSGEFAARVLKDAFEKNDFSKQQFSAYEKLWKPEFPDYGSIVGGKKALYTYSDEELFEVARKLPAKLNDLTTAGKIKIGLSSIIAKPGMLSKKPVQVMKAFAYSKADHYGW
ncbi:NAD(P)/FAD-dependent oxidoreductase [Candidatus Micrarchaeota archaeon]|nr:NAD(P)/FAD-dependent oxidoreductase [Candidatus Micrarchaeota archaeon]